MRRPVLAAATLVLGLALSSCGQSASSSGPGTTGSGATLSGKARVTVFAASSLTAAFTEMAELDPSLDVTFTFDGSPTLVDQIAAGAPADVLVTADETNMTKAAQADLLRSAPHVVATNTAVLIVPTGNPAGITGLDASLDGKKLVVCAPTVPCGDVARRIAASSGVALTPVSEEQKVTDVRGKVESGEADAGIVFATDAQASGTKVQTISVQGADAVATRYPVAVVKGSGHEAAAAAFIALVTGPRGQEVLARYGFGAP